MATAPILNVKLIGEENTTVLNRLITWTPEDKIENTIVINSSDTPKTIDITNVAKIRTMIFNGTGSFKVTMTVAGETIAYETQDIFMFSPTVTFRTTITSIVISTTSTSDIEVEIRIYGEV